MTLIRWNPIAPSTRFDPFFSNLMRHFDDESTERPFVPNVDIRENEENVILTMELPGLTKEDVNISVENGVLTVSGERKYFRGKGERVHLEEAAYGTFRRRFTLGEEIAEDKIYAKMDKGVLEIMFGKREAAKPRKVEVQVK